MGSIFIGLFLTKGCETILESTFYYDRISTVFVYDDCIVYVFQDGFTKLLDYLGLFLPLVLSKLVHLILVAPC